MKLKSILWIFCYLIVSYSCNPKVPSTWYLTEVSIIDPVRGPELDRTIVIDGNKIIQIDSTPLISIPPGAHQVSGKGQFVIPGLWDTHVHFAYIEALAPKFFDLLILHGITSVRDTGGKLDFVNSWKSLADQFPDSLPRVKVAGPLIDGLPNVYDGSSPARPPLSRGAGNKEDLEKLLNNLITGDVDLFKAYEMLTPDQFLLVCQKAKELGIPVTGHVPLSMDVTSASNAGLSSMEHLRNLELSCASHHEELLAARQVMLAKGKEEQGGVLRTRIHTAQRGDAIRNQDIVQTGKVLEVLAKNQTWQIPTLALGHGMVRRHFLREEWMETFQYLPEPIRTQWNDTAIRIRDMEISEESELFADWMRSMIQQIHEAGIGIMAGTDCPIFLLTPGYSLHEELALLVESGLTPLEAIHSATVRPAQYFGMQDSLGQVAPGMIADLVLLSENPLENIHNTLSIKSVIKDGRYWDTIHLEKIKNRLQVE